MKCCMIKSICLLWKYGLRHLMDTAIFIQHFTLCKCVVKRLSPCPFHMFNLLNNYIEHFSIGTVNGSIIRSYWQLCFESQKTLLPKGTLMSYNLMYACAAYMIALPHYSLKLLLLHFKDSGNWKLQNKGKTKNIVWFNDRRH